MASSLSTYIQTDPWNIALPSLFKAAYAYQGEGRLGGQRGGGVNCSINISKKISVQGSYTRFLSLWMADPKGGLDQRPVPADSRPALRAMSGHVLINSFRLCPGVCMPDAHMSRVHPGAPAHAMPELPPLLSPPPPSSVDPLHLPQDPAFVHGQYCLVIPHLLKHSSTGKLVAGFLEVIPARETVGRRHERSRIWR